MVGVKGNVEREMERGKGLKEGRGENMCRREKDDVIDFKRVRMLNNRPGFFTGSPGVKAPGSVCPGLRSNRLFCL